MAPTFLMTIDVVLLVVGGAVLSLCLIPIPPLQYLGNLIVRLLYKIRLHSPVPKFVRGTISPFLVPGVWGLMATAFSFTTWYNAHIKSSSYEGPPANPLDFDSGKRWKHERDIYMFAATSVIYLALHTLGRLDCEAGDLPLPNASYVLPPSHSPFLPAQEAPAPAPRPSTASVPAHVLADKKSV